MLVKRGTDKSDYNNQSFQLNSRVSRLPVVIGIAARRLGGMVGLLGRTVTGPVVVVVARDEHCISLRPGSKRLHHLEILYFRWESNAYRRSFPLWRLDLQGQKGYHPGAERACPCSWI